MHLRGKPVTLYAPTDLKNSYSLFETNPLLPDKSLKLEWVYGYRGKDARSNLYLLPTGELVYFMASVVVLFNPDLNKQRHYLGHTEEVKNTEYRPLCKKPSRLSKTYMHLHHQQRRKTLSSMISRLLIF